MHALPLSQAKVNETILIGPEIMKKIAGLNIPVNDSVCMQMAQRLKQSLSGRYRSSIARIMARNDFEVVEFVEPVGS